SGQPTDPRHHPGAALRPAGARAPTPAAAARRRHDAGAAPTADCPGAAVSVDPAPAVGVRRADGGDGMNLQHDKVQALCEQLRLPAIGAQWPALAQHAVANEASYGDFLEQALQAEMASRTERTRQTLQKLATLPSVKTLEAFDFGF